MEWIKFNYDMRVETLTKWETQKNLIIVTDGNNFGYIRPCEIDCFKENDCGIQGIPDSNSSVMHLSDITHWFELSKGED